jgi:hypothetical protein
MMPRHFSRQCGAAATVGLRPPLSTTSDIRAPRRNRAEMPAKMTKV